MIKFVITACSILHGGGVCKDFSAVHQVSFMTCITQNQQHLAHWQKSHPNWKVAKFTCAQWSPEHYAGKI